MRVNGTPATISGSGIATEGTLDRLADRADVLASEATADRAADAAELAAADFKRLLKFEPGPGEEIRRDETTTDDYHGAAPDGSLTSAAVWKVCRFYKTAGLITRVRYRTGVVWDDRALGW